MDELLNNIEKIAEIPSFSSYEDVLHAFLLHKARGINGCKVNKISEHNLLMEIPGNKDSTPVALAAHLDKINHFGERSIQSIPVLRKSTYLEGLMDDAVGLGIILTLAENWQDFNFPPLYLLLSEMEESTGLREHPELLRSRGRGLYHGMGAERLSTYLLDKQMIPSAVITVDTTPLFSGESGVALYGKHWEFTEKEPSKAEIAATAKLCNQIVELEPNILLSNNTNDYLHYGRMLNVHDHVVPSVAIEPAIYPYHQANERVFYADIERVYVLLQKLLPEL